MHIQFAELLVFDQDRAQPFYVEHFGCRVVADQPTGQNGWRWIELRFEGADTTLHFLRRKDEMPSTEPVLAFVDDDVEGTLAALQSKGVEIITCGALAANAHDRRVSRQCGQSHNSRKPIEKIHMLSQSREVEVYAYEKPF